ncbi:MAG: hypothetical protein IT368_12400, partial [Candidatus Hydrogenedentes bacterium]|nr:hypothetical protein [Candidatus Hydrogenedentota bacterium]
MIFSKWSRILLAAGVTVFAGTAFWGCGSSESSGGSTTTPAPEAGSATPASIAPSAYDWDTPDGWTEQPGTPLRQANFTAGENNQIEIYMTVLPGAGGGITANINRWRKQMGQDELTEEAVAALPALQVLGSEGRYVDIEGTYTGMGEEKHENYRMAGALLEQNGKAIFLKMVGPADAVAAQEAAFKQFAQSLKVAEAAPMQTAAAQPDPGARELPPGHPPIDSNGSSPMG